VSGIGFEVRIERSEFLAVNAGATLQRSALDEAFEWSEGHVTTHMLRTPDLYGFVTLTTYPLNAVELSLTGVYTGRMFAPHYAGAISEDRLEHTPSFFDASIRAAWTFWSEANLALTAGVYNMFNSYQRDFDRGPLRDAGYIYGPLRPRSFFFGIDAAL
jgi:outer membrane receptor for ferrienterochelin and colicins